MPRTVIISTARTPFGKMGGGLAPVDATDLGGTVIAAALERADVSPDQVELVSFGQVIQAGQGQIPSRQAQIKGGIPREVPSETVNKVCASGMKAVGLVDQAIRAGDIEVGVAGGMESMSNAPYLLPGARFGFRMGDVSSIDSMTHDGLTNPFTDQQMINEASQVSNELGVEREEMDRFAARSHQLADRARSSGVNDGAGAIVLASEDWAKENGKQILGTIVGYGQVGDDYAYLAKTPALAAKAGLEKMGRTADEVDLWEVNEAFASVALNTVEMLGVDEDKVNVNGGAIALGHPIGASGARLVGTLVRELKRRGGGLGCAAICSGGGQGDAIFIEV